MSVPRTLADTASPNDIATLCVVGAMLSHPGRVRMQNEDSVIYCLPSTNDCAGKLGVLALIADGMGGHAAGEVASRIAAQTIHLLYYQKDRPASIALAEGFAIANQLIFERSQNDPDCTGMGTTCTTIVVRDDCAWLGHVGDSRAYIVRGGEIYQISEDHSLVASLVRDGTLSPGEAATSPERNVILRALGTQPTVQPLIWNEGLPLCAGDVLVLCSDGLSDLVDEATIAATATELAPFEACEALISAALSAGGHDNISVGVFVMRPREMTRAGADRATRNVDVAALLEGPE